MDDTVSEITVTYKKDSKLSLTGESTTSSKKLPSTGEKFNMFAMYGRALMIVAALLGMVVKCFNCNPN